MQQAKLIIQQELSSFYSENELISISRLLISHITGYNFTEMLVHKNTIFSEQQLELLNNYLIKLKQHIPIQYVLGETDFLGYRFLVDENVLIPRPETEELVEWVCSDFHDQQPRILDIGTGSGCIPISLSKLIKGAQIDACDINAGALGIASKNAQLLGANVHFFQLDILIDLDEIEDLLTSIFDINKKWDVIISNPPYIPQSESALLEKHVLDFEPHIALFVPDNDPLLFYRKIAKFATHHLNKNGVLFFETHRDYAIATQEMLMVEGFGSTELRKDLSGMNRMLKAKF